MQDYKSDEYKNISKSTDNNERSGARPDRDIYRAREKLREMSSFLSETDASPWRNGRNYVSLNPVKGVAIALAAGVFLGGLIGRTSRHRH